MNVVFISEGFIEALDAHIDIFLLHFCNSYPG